MKLQLGNMLKGFWKDESAQGATEYILLLVAVVAIVVLFRRSIIEKVTTILGDLGNQMNQVTQGSSGNP